MNKNHYSFPCATKPAIFQEMVALMRGGGDGEESNRTFSSSSMDQQGWPRLSGEGSVHPPHRRGCLASSSSAPMNVPDCFFKRRKSCSSSSRKRAGAGAGGRGRGRGRGRGSSSESSDDDGSDDDDDDDDDDDSSGRVPPHLMMMQYGSVRNPPPSVTVGAGRTLKGRDLRDVRNTVWKQTGFL